jgi:hypothetical protein
MRNPWWQVLPILALLATLTAAGCYNTPVATSEHARGPAPLRMPAPDQDPESCGRYEDSLTGGQVFTMYCAYCHNAPALAERPFSNFKNVAVHMRIRANLTGKEYAKLVEFLRRWNDIPPPHPDLAPGPKRFFFSQPIPELRPPEPAMQKPADEAVPPNAATPAEEPRAR